VKSASRFGGSQPFPVALTMARGFLLMVVAGERLHLPVVRRSGETGARASDSRPAAYCLCGSRVVAGQAGGADGFKTGESAWQTHLYSIDLATGSDAGCRCSWTANAPNTGDQGQPTPCC